MNIRPLTGQCLVEILPENKITEGGITIPDTAKFKDNVGKLPPMTAMVWRVGPWPKKKNGLALIPEVAPRDRVLVSQYAGQKLKYLGGRFRLVPIGDILAKLS